MSDDQRAPQWGDGPAGITKQELLATSIGVFVIGCIVGWALFGKPAQLREVLKAGSLAEWIAAVATLVVGLGAWKYARVTYEFNVARERRLARAAYNNMYNKGLDAAITSANSKGFLDREPERRTLQNLRIMLEVDLSIIAGVIFTETELSYLDDDARDKFSELDFSLRKFRDLANDALKVLDGTNSREQLSAENCVHFEAIKRAAMDVDKRARVFIRLVRALRESESQLHVFLRK